MLRRIIVGGITAGVLLVTSGLVAAAAQASPNSCGDGGLPHAVHAVQSVRPAASPFDGCPSAI